MYKIESKYKRDYVGVRLRYECAYACVKNNTRPQKVCACVHVCVYACVSVCMHACERVRLTNLCRFPDSKSPWI